MHKYTKETEDNMAEEIAIIRSSIHSFMSKAKATTKNINVLVLIQA